MLLSNLTTATFPGDKWAYSFDVVHDIPQLIEKRGGKVGFVQSLEEHFNGGHNDHTNEVSQPTTCLLTYPLIQQF